MGSLVLKVEVMAGTSEDLAARDLALLARHLDLIVEAKFNGVEMRAHPNQDPRDVLREYERDRRLQNYPTS